MESYTGFDLFNKFKELGIETGIFGGNDIDAWYDTDCEDTKYFLNWLCENLSEDNATSARENEEFEQLLKNKLVLTGDEYGAELTNLKLGFPDILNYRSNIFEVECMADEHEFFLNDEKRLDELIQIAENLSTRLNKKISGATEEEINSSIQRENALEKTATASQKSDNIQKELHSKMIKYGSHLRDFEFTTRPSFISNNNLLTHNQFYSDIMSYLSLILKEQYTSLPKLESVVKSTKKKVQDSIYDCDVVYTELEMLKKRIYKSTQSKIFEKIKEEKLLAELKHLQNVNFFDLVATHGINGSIQFQLEASIYSKREHITRISAEIENLSRQYAEKLVNERKINIAEEEAEISQETINQLLKLESQIADILAKQQLLFAFFEKEKADIQYTDRFFRNVHHYITHNLNGCLIRTESMLYSIKEYNAYKKKPIEQKCHFFKDIGYCVSGNRENCTLASVLDALTTFESERRDMEVQLLFSEDCKQYRQDLRKFEKSTEATLTFLKSATTNKIVTIPSELLYTFERVDNTLERHKKSITSLVQIWNDASKKIREKKWFTSRRKLWIWFLQDPEKMLSAIEEIELNIASSAVKLFK